MSRIKRGIRQTYKSFAAAAAVAPFFFFLRHFLYACVINVSEVKDVLICHPTVFLGILHPKATQRILSLFLVCLKN